MNYKDMLNLPEFNALHPLKQQVIKELMQNNTQGSLESMLPQLMSVKRELSKRNLNFTKEESAFLIQIMKQNLTPEEQRKVDMLTGMLFH